MLTFNMWILTVKHSSLQLSSEKLYYWVVLLSKAKLYAFMDISVDSMNYEITHSEIDL